ncbi:hypothetical protein PENTCL1PPCAC_27935, partial [Pristionchus entomophagus]
DVDYFGNGENVQPLVFSMSTLCSYFGFLLSCAGCFVDFGSGSVNLYLHFILKITVLILMEYLIYSPLRQLRPWRIRNYLSLDYAKRYYRGLTLAASAVRY